MSKRGNETPRKSRRLNEESRSEEFHAPSFNILSQTQTQSSSAKEKSRTKKLKMKKKTAKGNQEEEKRERKGNHR